MTSGACPGPPGKTLEEVETEVWAIGPSGENVCSRKRRKWRRNHESGKEYKNGPELSSKRLIRKQANINDGDYLSILKSTDY